MAQGPMDPMAATLAGLQRIVDMMAQYMIQTPQQPPIQRAKLYKQIITFKKLVLGIYDTIEDAYQFLDTVWVITILDLVQDILWHLVHSVGEYTQGFV